MVINLQTKSAGVAADAGVSGADLDLAGSGRGDLEPPLGGGVAVVEDDGRKTGHGVLVVGDAVLLAGLAGGESGEGLVTDAGRAEGIEVGGIAGLTEVGGGNGSDGTAERVASHTDAVAGVSGLGGLDGRGNLGRNLLPGGVEAGVDETAAHEVTAGGLDENDAGWMSAEALLWYRIRTRCSTYLAIQLRTEEDPLKETVITFLTGSTETTPRISVTVPLF